MFSVITPLALGWIAGTALQLQQAKLWDVAFYWGLGAAALLLAFWRASHLRVAWWQAYAACVLASVLAFTLAGARASHYLNNALDPALEGDTLQVVGIVANLPQRTDDSVRFRFEVATAHAVDGRSVSLPPQLLLGWYGSRLNASQASVQAPPADLRPGDRWQLTVRLKAPHGHINPHGFDYELWLWEQGIQATGYVRHGPKDPPPKWLGSTQAHPVERLRDRVRHAIDAQVSDRAAAGVVAALVVGDQGAIDRADWDVFRATGVAHLMAISGLHITGLAWLTSLGASALWRHFLFADQPLLCFFWKAFACLVNEFVDHLIGLEASCMTVKMNSFELNRMSTLTLTCARIMANKMQSHAIMLPRIVVPGRSAAL